MALSNEFEIDFVSDAKLEWLAVEVSFRGQRFIQLTRENGIENIEIEFLTDLYVLPEEVQMKFSMEVFMCMVNEAKQALISAYENK